MTTQIIAYIAVGLCALSTGLSVYAHSQLRKARNLNAETLKLAEEAAKVTERATKTIIGGLAEKLARELAPMPQVGNPVAVKELFDALNAADLPAPGCPCAECDARRLRNASKERNR